MEEKPVSELSRFRRIFALLGYEPQLFQELIAPRCSLSAESACACSAAITAAAFVFGSVVLIGEALG